MYLPKKVLSNIKQLHGLRLGLGVGSGLVSSYYLVIVITIITTWFVHVEQDCKIKCYPNNGIHFQMLEQNIRCQIF